jgi:hypothetical protein
MRARISVGLLFACLSIGCGSSTTLAPDGSPEGGADTAVEEDGAGFCTPGADQTCNEDPSLSSLAGTCTSRGYCICHDGFSISSKTQRCRVGNTCVAAAADEWSFRMPIDASDCASRAPTICRNKDLDTSDLDTLMTSSACILPVNLLIRVELAGGCPTLLQASPRGLNPTLSDQDTQFLSCFATQLASRRFSCADSTCVLEGNILLP